MMRVGRVRYSTVLIPRRINSAYGWRIDRARMPCLSEGASPRMNGACHDHATTRLFPGSSFVHRGEPLIHPGGTPVYPGDALIHPGGAPVYPGGPLVHPGAPLVHPGEPPG